MAGSRPNLHTMVTRSACIQGVLKVKVKVKGHVIRALFLILGMSYSVIDGLVSFFNNLFKRNKLRVYAVLDFILNFGQLLHT